MSSEDGLRQTRERIQSEMQTDTTRREIEDQLQKAFATAGLESYYPKVVHPRAELKSILAEVWQQLTFTMPKRVRTMPNGITYARNLSDKEKPDKKSFDVVLESRAQYTGEDVYALWVFPDGKIAFSHNGNNDWDCRMDLKTIRQKIIDAATYKPIEKTPFWKRLFQSRNENDKR